MEELEYEVPMKVTQNVVVVVKAINATEARRLAETGPAAWIDSGLGSSSAETVDWRATGSARKGS